MIRGVLSVLAPLAVMGLLVAAGWRWFKAEAVRSVRTGPLGGYPPEWEPFGTADDWPEPEPFGTYPDEARWLAEAGSRKGYGFLVCPRCGAEVAHFCPAVVTAWVAPR